MALPVLVSSASGTYVSAPFTLDLTNVEADDYIIVTSQYNGSASGTFTVTDSEGHTYTAIPMQAGALDGGVYYARVVTGGTITVTVTRSSATNFFAAAYAVRNIDTSDPLDVTDEYTDPTASDNHYASASGVNTAANAFIVVQGRCTSTVTSTSVGVDYQLVDNTAPRIVQYKISADAITGERGDWVSTGTDRTANSFMASFKGTEGDGSSATGTASGYGSAAGVVYVPGADLTQTRYRWREDDGTESGASWAASESAPLSAEAGVQRLRVQIAASGDHPSDGFRLDYRPDGGAWAPVQTHPLSPPNTSAHAYWEHFARSPYCLYANSCRNRLLDSDYHGPTEGATYAYSSDISYNYAGDSHVRKQDAAKLYLLTNSASQYRPEMLINAGTEIPFRGKVLVMWDAWWDETWQTNRIAATGDTLLTHKCFQIASKYDNSWRWAEFRMGYANATAPDIATVDMRQYAAAHIGPNAYIDGDALKPQLASFTVKANTWTRWYVLIEFMRPDETYDRISWWIADEDTDPVHLFDRLQYNTGMGSPSSVPLGAACPLDPHLKEFWFEFNTSQSGTPSGPLIAYMRNFLALDVTNISSEDFPRLLVRPVA